MDELAFNRTPKRAMWKFDPMTNTGKYVLEEFDPGLPDYNTRRAIAFQEAGAPAATTKTVWDEASQTYKQAADRTALDKFEEKFKKEELRREAYDQIERKRPPQVGSRNMSGRGWTESQLRENYGPNYQQIVQQQRQSGGQQQTPTTSSGGGVSGIQFEYGPGVDPRTGSPRPKGYVGTYDPIYDPKYAFWQKGVPSRFYDPIDPTKPISFQEQTKREREARARWVQAMSDEEYSFFSRSGAVTPTDRAVRAEFKNPTPPKEEYGDPYKGVPGGPGLEFYGTELRGPARTGLGKSVVTTSNLPATTTAGAVSITPTTVSRANRMAERRKRMADRARRSTRIGA